MKKLLTVLFVATIAMNVFGQTETETIKKAKDLIADKKYESAFKVLQDFDPKNGKPDIVLLKEDIVLNYFVSSMMHQLFALKDLKKDEDIMDYRGKEGSFGMQMFEADKILDSLIKIYPNNYKLYKGLGDFYYDALLRYQGHWIKDDSIVSGLIIKNYQVVIDHNLADYNVYYKVGLEIISQKKYKQSIPYLIKSIELKKDFADAHYNLAYAYLYIDDRENALKYAKNSLDMYEEKGYKSDAARMIAQIYSELKDEKNTLKYYELANSIDPDSYYNLKPLLEIYVKTKDPKAQTTLNAFYTLAPDNPTIYNDLGDIYYSNKAIPELIEFYKSRLPAYKDDKKISGSLNFYLGQLYLDTDKKIAKEYFLQAKDIFSAIFDKDNAVFSAIEKGIKIAEK